MESAYGTQSVGISTSRPIHTSDAKCSAVTGARTCSKNFEHTGIESEPAVAQFFKAPSRAELLLFLRAIWKVYQELDQQRKCLEQALKNLPEFLKAKRADNEYDQYCQRSIVESPTKLRYLREYARKCHDELQNTKTWQQLEIIKSVFEKFPIGLPRHPESENNVKITSFYCMTTKNEAGNAKETNPAMPRI